jgi:hypothetical protein
MPTRSACVIAGASPAQVAAIATTASLTTRANRLGTLVTGQLGGLVVDFAFELAGPVYDVMWNAETGWFAVTIYRGDHISRWHNRPPTEEGYPTVPDVLGSATPRAILETLDIPPEAIGYVVT